MSSAQLRNQLQSAYAALNSLQITIADVSKHPRYAACREKKPIANLQIPNQAFMLWSRIQHLQRQLCIGVTKHFELVNDIFNGGKVSDSKVVNERLQKQMSEITRKCATLRREKRGKYLNKVHSMLMYGTEIALKKIVEPGGFTKGTDKVRI